MKINNVNRVVVFLFFSAVSMSYVNATDVIVMKFGYGEIYWGKKAFTVDPVVYPLKDSYAYEKLMLRQPDATTANLNPYYDFTVEENNRTQKERAIVASLKVWQKKHNVLAQVELHNKSSHVYFVYRGGMPSLSGVVSFGVMCGSNFMLTTENIKLDYLGRYCDFGDDRQNNWVDIKPGETFLFIVPINLAYEFLPGKHQYQIGSLEYEVVTKEWFSEVDTNSSMFSIFNRRSDCPIKTELPMVINERWLCPQYEFSANDLESILNDLGFDGGNSKNYFQIRTNQVSITINADKKTSYYQFMRDIKNAH
ncbi:MULTISPECIES: transposase [Enterobacterales]|uniref:transposase n=1 Tax=Enterobacterales TaxID=91347 RepID=UPI002EDA83D6